MGFQIAIDGPVGSGKSSLAKAVANKLGYIHIDTGAMFRAVAFYAVQNHLDFENEQDFIKALPKIDIKIEFLGSQKVFLNNQDITQAIRTAEIGARASNIAHFPSVRGFLLELQQKLAETGNIVMDGRDIGTVVLPQADLKIFLDAAIEVRINRRIGELEELGIKADYNSLKKQILKRDYDDSNRKNAPLKAADDAIIIDTSSMNMEQVLEHLLDLFEKIIKRRG